MRAAVHLVVTPLLFFVLATAIAVAITRDERIVGAIGIAAAALGVAYGWHNRFD